MKETEKVGNQEAEGRLETQVQGEAMDKTEREGLRSMEQRPQEFIKRRRNALIRNTPEVLSAVSGARSSALLESTSPPRLIRG